MAAEAVGYATEPGRSPDRAAGAGVAPPPKVIAADPGAAEERRQRAMGDRRVVITPGDDGMSELWALLPGCKPARSNKPSPHTAQQLGADDARTMDQRRADTLVDLLLGRTEPAAVDLQVIVPADTLTGASHRARLGARARTGHRRPDRRTHRTGTGWRPAPDVGAGTGTVSVRRLLTDPATGVLTDVAENRYRPSAALDRAVRARDVTCRFPGCRRAADSAGTDLDHTIPWPPAPPPRPTSPSCAGATTASNTPPDGPSPSNPTAS